MINYPSLIEKQIRHFVEIQRIVCAKIQTDVIFIDEYIFHNLMLINKELETLSYCRKNLSARNRIITVTDKSIMISQVRDSFDRLKVLHLALIEKVYK